MTCIVGLVRNFKIYMGADIAGISGLDLSLRRDSKVFIKGEMIFGFTSSFRMGQLLRYRLVIPEHPPAMDIPEYMATRFVDSVRECLKAGGFASKQNETESAGTFLVGYRGALFAIHDDYQVEERITHFNAVGCGAAYALGALCFGEGIDGRTRVIRALEAAETFSAGVKGPFEVLELKWGKSPQNAETPDDKP